jgi:uncharacterized protein
MPAHAAGTVDAPPATPWYRYPWVWLLIAIPGTSVVMGTVLLTLAIRSDDGLVADDYYREGLRINRSLARDAFAQRAGIVATVTREGAGVQVILHASEPLTFPPTLALKAMHATRSEADRHVVLAHLGDGRYVADRTWPTTGQWNLELGTERWRLRARDSASGTVTMGQ